MTVVYTVSQLGLAAAGVMILLRLLWGPTASDRIVALDTLLIVVVAAVAIEVTRLRDRQYAGILIVVSLLAFVGTVTVARFLQRREDR